MAVCLAANKLRIAAHVYIPKHCDKSKVAGIRALGGTVRAVGDNCVVSETTGRQEALAQGVPFISPYNDVDIVAGQGTLGVELWKQFQAMRHELPSLPTAIAGTPLLDAVFVSVGGGGLISGVAAYLKHVSPQTLVIAAQPDNSAVMYHSVLAGKIRSDVVEAPTLSDGTAGGIEANALTLPLCTALVDEWVCVGEAGIASALLLLLKAEHTLVEGAAALALAACLQVCQGEAEQLGPQTLRWRGHTLRRVAVVLCGRNIQFETLKTLMAAL